MVGSFTFAFNRLLVSGAGARLKLEKYIPVTGGRLGLVAAPSFMAGPYGAEYLKRLKDAGFEVLVCEVHGEPSPESVNGVTDEFSGFSPDLIAAVGGGSVIDSGKAVAAMLPVEGKVEEYLEGVGTKTPSGEKIPFIALPTTSGTGSEATMNAVISCKGPTGFKKSIRHPHYIPDAAVLDPELILSCPASVTAACGMDAFSQLLESYLSSKASPFSDLLALDGLKRFLSSFGPLMADLENAELRMEVSLASYYSGLTLANAGLGVVHGLAGPIGGFSRMNHGAACGTLLYDAFRMTVDKIRAEKPGDSAVLSKMDGLGEFLSGKSLAPGEGADALLAELEGWTKAYNLPGLSDFGLTGAELGKIADAGGNKNHPVAFSRDEMIELLGCRL